MYAVIKSGGKQHRVEPGEELSVEKLDAAEGETIEFDEVMLAGEGADVKIGAPYIDGAKVSAEVVAHHHQDASAQALPAPGWSSPGVHHGSHHRYLCRLKRSEWKQLDS